MDVTLDLVWNGGLTFSAIVDGHNVVVDSQHESDSSAGPSPKKLLMVSLAGCTGMDVVSILNKMRVNFSKFSVKVNAVVADDHPKKYLKIELDYQLDARTEDMEKILKAINLSKDRYCGVWNTLAPALPVEYKVSLV